MQRFTPVHSPSAVSGRFGLHVAASLLLLSSLAACGSTDLKVSPGSRAHHVDGGWSTYVVEQGGLGKKIRFRDAVTGETITMGYKGIPVGWGSAINLVVSEKHYKETYHRARYRFRHPFTTEGLVLEARATSQSVVGLPLRRGEAAPRMDVVTLRDKEPVGGLAYDFAADVLLRGELAGRSIEIEKLDGRRVVDGGLIDHLLFPFPVAGDYSIRVDGRELARFRQEPARGFQQPYRLELLQAVEAGRDEAMLAFIAFDRMRDFVGSGD